MEETITFSSTTVPHFTQAECPPASWKSISREPHDGHCIAQPPPTTGRRLLLMKRPPEIALTMKRPPEIALTTKRPLQTAFAMKSPLKIVLLMRIVMIIKSSWD